MRSGTPPPWLEDDPVPPKSPLSIWYHDLYTMGIDPTARFPRDRYKMLEERIRDAQLPSPIEFREPGPASADDLLRVHGPDYVDRFLGGRLSDREINRIGLKPWRSSFAQRTLQSWEGAYLRWSTFSSMGEYPGTWREGPITPMLTLGLATASSTTSRSVPKSHWKERMSNGSQSSTSMCIKATEPPPLSGIPGGPHSLRPL